MNAAEKIYTKQDVTVKKLKDIFYEKYLEPNESDFDYSSLELLYNYEKNRFGEITTAYTNGDKANRREFTNFEFIKTSKDKNKVRLLIKNISENIELIIPSTIYDENATEFKVEKVAKKQDDFYFMNLETLAFDGDFDVLKIMKGTFEKSDFLQTVDFNGNVKELTIGSMAFKQCLWLTNFTVSGSIKCLTIGSEAFSSCTFLTDFKIPNSVTSLTIKYGAFIFCQLFKVLEIPKSTQNLDIDSFMLFGSSIERIYMPKHLKNKISTDFNGEEKIIYK